jgi:type III pantothenate kinase
MLENKFLTLDIGNTRNKYAVFTNTGEIVRQGGFDDMADLFALGDVGACIYSQVGRHISDLPKKAIKFNSELNLPLNIRIDQQHSLGADRLAAVLGVKYKYGVKNCLVIDAGTCVTFDYLLNFNDYEGGAISPGLKMRFKMLNNYTAALPNLANVELNALLLNEIGKNTDEAIFSGVLLGILFEIEERINRFNEQYVDTTIVLTGGDAAFLANHIKTRIFVEPLLIHYGLYHAIKSI